MSTLPASLHSHRVSARDPQAVCEGYVRYSPRKSLWFLGMATASILGCTLTFSWLGVVVFLLSTGAVLLFGHSLGSHRKLIHDSFQCPKWLEYVLVYMGVQVGLAGPFGLLRAHELRDYAQRLPDCHDYLRHGSSFWLDAWWQLNCELHLANPPRIHIEDRVSKDVVYRFFEATWMLQQVPPAILLYVAGGWTFVFFGVCARVTAGVLGHWLIGYFAHNDGGMHFRVENAAVQGRNIRLTSILTMGECWHNNHHAYPGSAKLGLFAGEWDPGWWTLLLLRRMGLVRALRLPQHLPSRDELRALDSRGAALLGSPRDGAQNAHGHEQSGRDIWNIVRNVRPSRTSAEAGQLLEWPAAILSPQAMGWLTGGHVPLAVDPARSRLMLRLGAKTFVGLPAVCILLAQRSRVAWIVTVALLPVALTLESVRRALAFERRQEAC